jgi:hypothetical protein
MSLVAFGGFYVMMCFFGPEVVFVSDNGRVLVVYSGFPTVHFHIIGGVSYWGY